MRYFKDPNVLREAGRTGEFVDPAGDAETIMTELILADLQTLEKQLPKLEKEAKRDRELAPKLEVAQRLVAWLNDGNRAATLDMTPEERAAAKGLFLLTMKPILYVANVDEDMLGEELELIDGVTPIPSAPRLRPSSRSSSPRRRRSTWRRSGSNAPAGGARAGGLQATRPAVVLYRRRDGGQGVGRCAPAPPHRRRPA